MISEANIFAPLLPSASKALAAAVESLEPSAAVLTSCGHRQKQAGLGAE